MAFNGFNDLFAYPHGQRSMGWFSGGVGRGGYAAVTPSRAISGEIEVSCSLLKLASSVLLAGSASSLHTN